jgi:hypothetical protein
MPPFLAGLLLNIALHRVCTHIANRAHKVALAPQRTAATIEFFNAGNVLNSSMAEILLSVRTISVGATVGLAERNR